MYTLQVENKTVNIVDCWEEMSISQFIELGQILSADIPETYKTVNAISALSNVSVDDLENMRLSYFNTLKSQLEFLNTEIPKVKHKNRYVLNGRIYKLDADLSAITTAQYMDYQTYIKENNPIKLVSLWLIPEGHQYNDGYSLEQVMLDIRDMGFLDVQAIAFFLQMQLAAYILILKDYSKKEMKKMKVKKKDIDKLQTHLNNMASFLLS